MLSFTSLGYIYRLGDRYVYAYASRDEPESFDSAVDHGQYRVKLALQIGSFRRLHHVESCRECWRAETVLYHRTRKV